MTQKVNGLIPEAGSFIEGGSVIFVRKAATSLTEADVLELQAEGVIIMLENDGTNTYAALGYASEAPAGWTVGTFAVA